MSCLVKICGMKHDTVVDAAVEAGADALGFVFSESPRRVTARHAAFIARNVPAGVLRVAVMLHPSPTEWDEVLAIFCPDVLQTDLEDFESLNVPDEVARWPVIREGAPPAELPSTFVFEGKKSGAGETADWSEAVRLAGQGRLILAGGLNAENVAGAIRRVGPYGVDVSSGVESSAGRKEPELIEAFIRAVRAVPSAGGSRAETG